MQTRPGSSRAQPEQAETNKSIQSRNNVEFLFLAELTQFTVDRNLGKGFWLDPFYLTNNRDVIRRMLSPAAMAVMGKLHVESMLSGKCVLYATFEATDS